MEETQTADHGPELDRSDFAQMLSERSGVHEWRMLETLKILGATLADALVQGGGRVEIAGLGVFRLETRAPRKGVTPDGEPWEVGGRQEIVFHAAPAVNAILTERTGVETYSN